MSKTEQLNEAVELLRLWSAKAREVLAAYIACRERIAELEAILAVVRYTLTKLPEDALGIGGDNTTHWFVRDRLVEQIEDLLPKEADDDGDD